MTSNNATAGRVIPIPTLVAAFLRNGLLVAAAFALVVAVFAPPALAVTDGDAVTIKFVAEADTDICENGQTWRQGKVMNTHTERSNGKASVQTIIGKVWMEGS